MFNYYDREWGQIVSDPDSAGWFDFRPEGARQCRVLNGERIASTEVH